MATNSTPRSSRSAMMALLSDCELCCASPQLLAFSLLMALRGVYESKTS